MSSDTSPAEAFWKVLPRSVERHTPPISSPAKTRSGSSGSKVICVTRGRITAGQVSGSGRLDALPGLRAVGRAEDAGRPRTGEDQVGIVRRARDRPDAQAVHRRGQVGPFAARDVEPVDAGIGAGEQLVRALRMRGERPHPRLAVHSRGAPETLQRLAEVVAVPDGQSRRADIEARRHASLPCGVLVFDTGRRRPAPNDEPGAKSASMRCGEADRRATGSRSRRASRCQHR